MHDLTKFRMSNVAEMRSVLRDITTGAKSLEEAAERIVRYLYLNIGEELTNTKQCALVRFYKTHSYGELTPELRLFAIKMLPNQLEDEVSKIKCLTLFATAGEKPEWNLRSTSMGHKAIPLPSEKVVAQLPMVSQLVKQFGIEINSILKPAPSFMVDMAEKTYNVFYVPEALGSPYVPAQREFVVPFNIKSVIGVGGILPGGDLFAVIIFLKIPISLEIANMFRTLALGVKAAVLPFVSGKIFIK